MIMYKPVIYGRRGDLKYCINGCCHITIKFVDSKGWQWFRRRFIGGRWVYKPHREDLYMN